VPPPLRVFVDVAEAALAARLASEATRAGWIVVGRPEDAGAPRTRPGPSPAWDGEAASAPVEALTPRELDVLALLAEGAGNRAIAERLGISDHTVKFHLSAIFGKLDVTTRTAAVRKALRLGWIDA
jgi:DNA-binding NarL/FixJ family response regulator